MQSDTGKIASNVARKYSRCTIIYPVSFFFFLSFSLIKQPRTRISTFRSSFSPRLLTEIDDENHIWSEVLNCSTDVICSPEL